MKANTNNDDDDDDAVLMAVVAELPVFINCTTSKSTVPSSSSCSSISLIHLSSCGSIDALFTFDNVL